ncbi:MAG TPA: hypothetical protein VGN57_11175 [Pirellulaceae bacterium]|jgi:hypothetical protein|nr:hypothetical protein [Pirellulaceae bacterium]
MTESESATDVAPPRRKGCGCWTIVFVTLLAATLFVVGVYVFWRWSNARGVERMIAIAREKGEPTTPEELAASYPTSPEIERTTQLWLTAGDEAQLPYVRDDLIDVVTGYSDRENPESVEAMRRYRDERILSPRVLEASQAYFARVEGAVDLAQQARRSGVVARYALRNEGEKSPPDDHIQKLRAVANVLAIDLELRRVQAPRPAMGERLLTLIAVGESLRNEPSESAQLVRLALLGVADSHLTLSLEAEELSDEEIVALQRSLGEMDHRANLRRALEELQVEVFHSFEKYGKVEKGVLLSPEEDSLSAATALREVLDASANLASASEAARAADERVQAASKSPAGEARFSGTSQMLRHVHALIFAFRDSQSRMDALEAIVACERFRRAQGVWPDSLDQLVPDWLDAVPVDTYTGDPLRYRRTETGLSIYAVGPDGSDDGGVVEWGSRPNDPGARVELGKNVLRLSREDEAPGSSPELDGG